MSATGGAKEGRPRHTIDETALAHQAHEAWEKKAAFWDQMMGEGNAFQRVLIGPATERLLRVLPGETVLESPAASVSSRGGSRNSGRGW
jgi:hypothetical protein